MLRKDTEATLARSNSSMKVKLEFGSPIPLVYGYFKSSELVSPIFIGDYDGLLQSQRSSAVAIAKNDRKTWWMFHNEFWCEDEGYSPSEVEVLILAMQIREEQKRERKIANATAIVNAKRNTVPGQRERIPDSVKLLVWRRDGGKCVKCGSNVNLEFDHVIPVASGGSNTARNIQLLCEKCNRSKGSSLV